MSRFQHPVSKSLPRGSASPPARIVGSNAACSAWPRPAIAFFCPRADRANTTADAQVEGGQGSSLIAKPQAPEAEVAKRPPRRPIGLTGSRAEAAVVSRPPSSAEEASEGPHRTGEAGAGSAARAQAAADAECVTLKRIRTDSDDHEPWALVRKNEAGYSMSGSTAT
jgi:hypothetical protein